MDGSNTSGVGLGGNLGNSHSNDASYSSLGVVFASLRFAVNYCSPGVLGVLCGEAFVFLGVFGVEGFSP
jgi:hypothetical protein